MQAIVIPLLVALIFRNRFMLPIDIQAGSYVQIYRDRQIGKIGFILFIIVLHTLVVCYTCIEGYPLSYALIFIAILFYCLVCSYAQHYTLYSTTICFNDCTLQQHTILSLYTISMCMCIPLVCALAFLLVCVYTFLLVCACAFLLYVHLRSYQYMHVHSFCIYSCIPIVYTLAI